ncbi:MAG: hypothetical protein GY861_03515 [bacterium]|nr:hypothetical protein [bacterium]
MAGIKETKEVMALVKAIAIPILKEVKKDGFQPQDILAFIGSPGFTAALQPAISGITQVPAEVADISVMEGLELGKYVYDIVQEIMAEV